MRIKDDFHYLIDTIDDEAVLKEYYEIIQTLNSHQSNNSWSKLSSEQQRLVLLSYEESFDEKNLVSHEDVMKKYAKWLEQ